MRKSYLILLSSLCLAQAATAQAYVYRYAPNAPAVVTDMSVLNPAPQQDTMQAPAQTAPAQKPQELTQPFFTTAVLTPPPARHGVSQRHVSRRHVPHRVKHAASAAAKPEKPSLQSAVAAAPQATALSAAETAAAPKAKTEAAQPAVKAAPALPAAAEAMSSQAENQTTPPEAESSITPPEAAGVPPAVPTPAGLTLDFAATSSDLTRQAKGKLDSIAQQMKDVDDLRLQIRGYARGDGSSDDARRMSLSRVLEVRSYLMNKGIKPIRLDVQALGSATSSLPVDRVDLVFER